MMAGQKQQLCTQCARFSRMKSVMVSLALLKLHCVSKIAFSHLCLQSIPSYGRGALHTPGLPARTDATNSIGTLQDGRVGLQCSTLPEAHPHYHPFFNFCKSFNVQALRGALRKVSFKEQRDISTHSLLSVDEFCHGKPFLKHPTEVKTEE